MKEDLGYISKEDIGEMGSETCSRRLVKDRSRFNQKRIQQALTVDISKGQRINRANKRDPSKTFNSIKIN